MKRDKDFFGEGLFPNGEAPLTLSAEQLDRWPVLNPSIWLLIRSQKPSRRGVSKPSIHKARDNVAVLKRSVLQTEVA